LKNLVAQCDLGSLGENVSFSLNGWLLDEKVPTKRNFI